MHRALMGDGLYTWGNLNDAQSYLNRLSAKGIDNLSIMEFQISKNDFDALSKLDVSKLSPSAQDAFLDNHTRYSSNPELDNWDYINRKTGLGEEHYFNKRVYSKLKILKK